MRLARYATIYNRCIRWRKTGVWRSPHGIPAYEAALKANNKNFTIHTGDGANHGFNNDIAAPRDNKEASGQDWSRTIDFFKEYLGNPPSAN
jgi:dienelactone hydrolase